MFQLISSYSKKFRQVITSRPTNISPTIVGFKKFIFQQFPVVLINKVLSHFPFFNSKYVSLNKINFLQKVQKQRNLLISQDVPYFFFFNFNNFWKTLEEEKNTFKKSIISKYL